MNRNCVLSIIHVMLIAGCASVPTKDIRFDSQADAKANFGGYETYAWLGNAAIVNDAYGQWEPPAFDADAEIKYLIDRELRKRGMSQTSIGDADLIVAFAAGINMDALGLKVDPKTKVETLRNIPKGGLMIALVDRNTQFAIWWGLATANIQKQPDTKTVKVRLDYTVTRLLRMVPK